MPSYNPPSTGGGGGAVSSVAGKTGVVTLSSGDVSGDAPLASPVFSGTPSLPTATIGVTQSQWDLSTKLSTTAYADVAGERHFIVGQAGTISASETDLMDFVFVVPYNCTAIRMKAACQVAPTGAMSVQMRKSSAAGTATWSNLTNFVVSWTANQLAAAGTTPASPINLTEGDFLGASVSTGSGTNLAVILVVRPR